MSRDFDHTSEAVHWVKVAEDAYRAGKAPQAEAAATLSSAHAQIAQAEALAGKP